ncbi:hypothetical protein [Streptomyces sp. CBMA156]|uniref:hypothetical protein n=1 Tax=Streptomyces sp. CBMA156 TaxID=1930280 RepID=UPI00166195D8|nr:hypothetical protein [Streptomyces sp. CBMA156]MBD0676640.1 hypothetical protein [Streptomyces sp. CBMA156]
MPEPPQLPGASSRPLPPYQGLLGLDVRRYTDLPGVVQAPVSAYLEPLLDAALTAAGLDELRTAKRFLSHSGDGLALGFASELMPHVIHPGLGCLSNELARHNAAPNRVRLRMRASLHAGHVTAEGSPGEGNGPARNELHRLLDSEQVKEVLAHASPATTHLVAILSDHVYRESVRELYTGLPPRLFKRVRATVPGRDYSEWAWIYDPAHAGNPLFLPDCERLHVPKWTTFVDTIDRLHSTIRRLLDRY